MAKSTRSKVKRHFRAKKRTEGVYAAAEAARLNRLHNRIKGLTTKGEEIEDIASNMSDEEEDQMRGLYDVLGLFDPEAMSSENMEGLSRMMTQANNSAPRSGAQSDAYGLSTRRSRRNRNQGGQDMFNHLFN
ncbi:hypothetical protein NLI96_g9947 [Meripilus lineatus]|uniref:DUF2423 domain-containing protein n=1 Tax=Meripilus lineatus TaxID=2056292 RepID=A0AAD5UZR9_9APHY|nr:hypothetical protein NLI96_g9947 [Physisporinus lineatus]